MCGDNDTGKEHGTLVLNGGYYSGQPYNHNTKYVYTEPAAGHSWVTIDETIDGRKYILEVK